MPAMRLEMELNIWDVIAHVIHKTVIIYDVL